MVTALIALYYWLPNLKLNSSETVNVIFRVSFLYEACEEEHLHVNLCTETYTKQLTTQNQDLKSLNSGHERVHGMLSLTRVGDCSNSQESID